ncbi:hypothetical protein pdam_00005255, partial [Pocillopora damicornis]
LSVYYPNIAINQSTEQSSTASDGDSNHGVDAGLGIKFEWKKCVKTQVEDNPWWKVDLGGIYQIEAATITNTYESCCNDKLQQVDLTVAFYEDDPIDAQQVCHQNLTYLSRGRVTVRCNQLPFGRYFFVSIPKTQWEMSFCEVEVYPNSGGAARSFSHGDLRHQGGINLSEGKPTNQSSTSGDAVSSRAVDGNLNPLFSIGQSCSSTTSQANAWWQLDLEEVVYVAHIFIQFRSRCCDSQATHFLIYA